MPHVIPAGAFHLEVPLGRRLHSESGDLGLLEGILDLFLLMLPPGHDGSVTQRLARTERNREPPFGLACPDTRPIFGHAWLGRATRVRAELAFESSPDFLCREEGVPVQSLGLTLLCNGVISIA